MCSFPFSARKFFRANASQVLKFFIILGCSLSASSFSRLIVNPRLEEADILVQWWRRGGFKRTYAPITQLGNRVHLSLQEVKKAFVWTFRIHDSFQFDNRPFMFRMSFILRRHIWLILWLLSNSPPLLPTLPGFLLYLLPFRIHEDHDSFFFLQASVYV